MNFLKNKTIRFTIGGGKSKFTKKILEIHHNIISITRNRFMSDQINHEHSFTIKKLVSLITQNQEYFKENNIDTVLIHNIHAIEVAIISDLVSKYNLKKLVIL